MTVVKISFKRNLPVNLVKRV